MIVAEFEQPPIKAARSQLAKALEAMKGVYRASASEDGRLLTVLAEVDSDVTVERVLKYLELAGYKAAEASAADYGAEIARQGGRRAGPVKNDIPAEPAAPANTRTAANVGGTINNVCPVSGKAISADAASVGYNGFNVGLCCNGCESKFTAMPSRKKDSFVAEFVKPVDVGCAVSRCPDGPEPARVTYNGKLIKLCCPACLKRWETVDDAQRDEWYAKNVVALANSPSDTRPAPDPAACTAGVTPATIAGPAKPADVADETNGRVLRVDGITCQACVDSIAKALSPIDGVKSVAGNVESKVVWVGFEPDRTVSDKRLIKAVKAAGFDATVLDNVVVRSASSSGGANDAPACGTVIKAQTVTPVGSDQVGESNSAAESDRAEPEMVSLDDSLKPLIDAFNADKGKLRFVTILSPT